MITRNVSELLKPMAQEAKALNWWLCQGIEALEIRAMKALEMDCTYGTDGKLFIKIYPDGTIEIRHHTNNGTYYYYPLNSGHTDPWQCQPRERFYTYDFSKTYRKGWKKT
jgi:hypothetical protein